MSSLKYLAELFFSLLPFVALYVFLRKPSRKRFLHRRSVVVVVLGDIGRSPRMMYHSQSFAQHDFETFIVGYRGSEPPKSLRELPHVHFLYLPTLPQFILQAPRSLFLLVGPLKVIFQTLAVLHALLVRLPYTTEFIIVQNPPSIPTLAIVQFVNRTQKSKLIIDWHNLGYSILAIRLGNEHRLVKIAEWFERTFGRVAYAHLFVTKAMKDHLVKKWQLKGRTAVLHDRPPSHFHPCSPAESHDLFCSMPDFLPPVGSSFLPSFKKRTSTPFTRLASPYEALSSSAVSGQRRSATPEGLQEPTAAARSLTMAMATDVSFSKEAMSVATRREDRPALVITSTSWTADERFDIFLEALRLYERRASEVNGSKSDESPRLPKIMAVVTGKGDLREKSMQEVMDLEESEQWKWVRCRSVWLSAADYPILLGSADLGVSLHKSSSDLDLPMKIVDMFGCGLPVCALNFACLDELVKPGINGVVFDTAQELAEHFEHLLASFPTNPELDRLTSSLRTHVTSSHPSPSLHAGGEVNGQEAEWQWGSWDQNWDRVVRPLVGPTHYSTL
ncbi:mannosyltransferase [Clavulina sp. PMI_390]|nr:mannosyltransferase [Clavulina sp. PMI_390]